MNKLPTLFFGLLVLLSTGCPTPPTPQQTGNNSTTSNGGNAGNAGNPGGNGGANAGGNGGNGGNQPNNPPGQNNQGGPGPVGKPPGAEGDTNPNQPNNPQKNPNGEDVLIGPSGITPDGGENSLQQPEAVLTIPSDAEIEKDGSIMGVFNDLGGQDLPAKYTQDAIASMTHVTLSGKISCNGSGCDYPYVLRVTPSFIPSQENGPLSENLLKKEGGMITSKKLKGAGDFSIVVPKSDTKVVLELLIDEDSDGAVSLGEKFVIYEGGGGISLDSDKSGVNFAFSPANLNAPLGGAKPVQQE